MQLEANLPALFEQLWLQLKGPEPAADTGAPCFLGAPRLAAALDTTSHASDDPAALVDHCESALDQPAPVCTHPHAQATVLSPRGGPVMAMQRCTGSLHITEERMPSITGKSPVWPAGALTS